MRWSRFVAAFAAGVLVLTACSGTPTESALSKERPAWPHDVRRYVGPPDALDQAGLLDTMVRRGSVRDLSAERLDDDELAALLWSAQGISSPTGARTVPSAGALYPLEVYVVTPDDVLHYLPDPSSVEVRNGAQTKAVISEAIRDVPASRAYAMIVITGVPGRITGKYGERGIRYMWLEAGHAAQNLVLAAAAMRLGAVTIGAFDDGAVADALGLSDAEIPLYLIAVGRPLD